MTDNLKIKYLVADTTAFINSVQLNEYAENILTVPDVINEVKSKRQIRRLVVLPFDLQIRDPKPESIQHCVEFAKKTGDYASLSGIDMKVIALTYELECENVGSEHLRKDPVVSKVVASKDKPEEFQDNTLLAGFYNPKNTNEANETRHSECVEDAKAAEEVTNTKDLDDKCNQTTNESPNTNEDDEITEEELRKCIAKLSCDSAEELTSCDVLVPEHPHQKETDSEESVDGTDEEDEDNSSSWINPSNIAKVKKDIEGKTQEDVPLVACMSTDFSIQNVLKQINCNVAALNGRIIHHVRTYILRCYACFKTTSIITKVFCPNCGNKTLKRVAVSLDENGKQVIHINTRRPLTSKYKNQSIPRFRGGKHSHNPILFEDQPIPRQMPSRVAKTKTNALEENYVAGLSPFVRRDVDSKSAMLRSKGNLKEWARNNTYEEDRRRKHYNRLVKYYYVRNLEHNRSFRWQCKVSTDFEQLDIELQPNRASSLHEDQHYT